MGKLTLKAARVNAGLTQKQAAEAMRISNKTLCAWENGKQFPSVIRAKELCELYRVEFDMINFDPNPPL